MTTWLVLAAFAIVGGIGYLIWKDTRSSRSPLLTKRPKDAPDHPGAHAADETPAVGRATFFDPVITDPPVVVSVTGQRDTVGDHIKHFNWKGYSLDEVVFETYRRVLKRPHLASYFHGVKDLNALQRHFTHFFKIVTMDGIRTEAYRNLAVKHARVRDRDGRPITGAAYDEVIAIFAEVLAEKGVPASGTASLGPVVTQLRRAIVVDPA